MSGFVDSADVAFKHSIGYNATLEGDFIAQEIEFLLPDVIRSLEIPVVLDAGAKQRLEYSLTGKKGFRALPKAARAKAVKQLKDSAFAKALRNAQQIVLTHSQANSTNLSYLLEFTGMERTTSEPMEPIWSPETPTVDYEIGYQRLIPTREEEVPGSTVESSPSDAAIVAEAAVPERVTDVTFSSLKKEKVEVFEVPKIPIELQEPIVGRDIRGLIALLRGGKVVAFVEEVAGQLVDEDVEKIEIPKKKVFARLEAAGLIAEYHALSSIENLQDNSQLLKEFHLIDALLVAVENDEQWSRINTRRFHLITKKYTLGLSPNEDSELEKLDELAERQMYSALELPFAELAMLEAYAASVGLRQTAA
jgi:hypothetical protein